MQLSQLFISPLNKAQKLFHSSGYPSTKVADSFTYISSDLDSASFVSLASVRDSSDTVGNSGVVPTTASIGLSESSIAAGIGVSVSLISVAASFVSSSFLTLSPVNGVI